MGIRKGIVDGNSHPHGTVLEEILVHMLQRVYNNKVFLGTGSVVSVSIDTSYRNGQPSEWARDAWKWGLEKGIVDGNSHPHGEVTEEIWYTCCNVYTITKYSQILEVQCQSPLM